MSPGYAGAQACKSGFINECSNAFFENRGKVVDGSRHEGHMVDALASESEEGRGRLRKSSGSCERAKIRGYPNGGTRQGSYPVTAW